MSVSEIHLYQQPSLPYPLTIADATIYCYLLLKVPIDAHGRSICSETSVVRVRFRYFHGKDQCWIFFSAFINDEVAFVSRMPSLGLYLIAIRRLLLQYLAILLTNYMALLKTPLVYNMTGVLNTDILQFQHTSQNEFKN